MTMNAPEAINTTIPIKQAAELLAVIADFQDQAMCLAQAIEKHLEPIAGQDSAHFSAWRLCQVLTAHLEAGFLQSHASKVLGVSAD